jgi:hypothetical protein
MQSHFEINVSLDGRHLFATAPRSCTTEAEAKHVLEHIKLAFKDRPGFKISITHWECRGRRVVA